MLTGKTALVTGASRGIGREIALKLASEGADIVLNYVKSSEAVQEVMSLIKDAGVKVEAFQADVSIMEEAKNLINYIKETFGGIDILVNNAGITRDNILLRMSEEDFDEVINVNLKGAFNCMKCAAPFMVKKRWGRIVNISSVSGLVGNAGQVNYAAAKAGILGMTKSAARELAGRGITVNAVAPGFIETDMTRSLPEKVKEIFINNIPQKRAGSPLDVANAVLFLVSDNASYITGQVINVDGGMVM